MQYTIDALGYGFTYLFVGSVVLASSPCALIIETGSQVERRDTNPLCERKFHDLGSLLPTCVTQHFP